MIAGLGIDVVDLASFSQLVREPGTAFLERTFTAQERQTASSRPSGEPMVHLAARYAAKEACVKALAQALASSPIALPKELAALTEIEVINDEHARPSLALCGRVRALTREAGVRILHLSMSHDGPFAAAVVVAER